MRRAVLMMILAVMSSSAMAKWVEAGSKLDVVSTYIDPATIRKEGNMVKVWTLTDRKAPRTIGGVTHLSMKQHEEYDCKEKQSRSHGASFHSRNMGKGKVVYSDSVTSEWEPVYLGSAGEILWKIACEKQ